MKLHAKHSNIERGGVHSETSFTIKTNALSFSILSSGLYTDPIMAIVRELSCNAYDAHIDAKNATTPFEIHLPNELEPFFAIKDFGTGLSDADIQGETVPVEDKDGNVTHTRSGGLYTTYFDSTKTNSNDFIGALGLGSKSPFSYTDAFEVISRHEGTKRTYAIFLNEEGIPTVALMGKIETDEHSGLEIKLAIKKEDFHTFRCRTATALKFFKVKPTIKGALNFEFDKIPSNRIETQGWMLSRAMGYYNSSIVAVQGNVQYRVDSAQIKDHIPHDLQTFISKTNIVLFFNIGELEVAANREEIRYDNQSVEAIVAGINKVHANLTPEIELRIGTIDTNYWEACIDLNNLSSELFNNVNFIIDHAKAEAVKSDMLEKYINQRGQVMFDGMFGYDLYHYRLNSTYGSTSVKRKTVSGTYSPHGDTTIVINDVKTGGIKRLADYLENHSIFREAFLVTKRKEPHAEFDIEAKIIPYVGCDKELKKFKEQLGNPEILLLSEITEAPDRSASNTQNKPVYRYGGVVVKNASYYSQSHKTLWERSGYPLDAGGIYIPLKYGSQPSLLTVDGKFDPITDDEPDEFNEMVNFLIDKYNEKNDTNYVYTNLYGLSVSAQKIAKKDDKWVNLFDFAIDMIPEFNIMLNFFYKKKVTEDFAGLKEAIKWAGFNEMVEALPKKSDFRKALMPLIEGRKKYTHDEFEKLKTIANIEKLFRGFQRVKQKPFFDQTTFNKYGMLTMITPIGYDTDWDTLKKYIKMIDRSK